MGNAVLRRASKQYRDFPDRGLYKRLGRLLRRRDRDEMGDYHVDAPPLRDGAGYCVEGNSLREKDSAIPPLEEYIQQTNVL